MTSFLDRPVFEIRPDWNQPRAGQVDDHTFDIQGQARGTPWKVTLGPKRTVDYQFLLRDRASIGSFRRFVADRQGRLLGFWLPVYLRDFQLTQDQVAGDTSLSFRKIGLHDAVASFTQFKALVIATWDRLECYSISSVAVDDDVETVTISPGLAGSVSSSTVICGGLLFARFSDDELQYDFVDFGACKVEARFEELPAEYEFASVGTAPIYLYELVRAGVTTRYCNWAVDLTIDSNAWASADITHGAIKASIDFVDDGPSLTLGTDDPNHPLRALLDRYLLQMTMINIYESDALTLATPSAPIYSGRLGEVTFAKKGLIQSTLSSLLWMGEQQGPRLNLQRVCAHQTYDAYCTLNAADFTTSGTITAVSASPASVDADEFGAKATAQSDPNWFALGLVTCGQEQRFCTGQDGNRLYLNVPFKSATIGASISARAGDDKRIGTCNGKFNNVANFFGIPYAPNKSPQFEALQAPKAGGGKKG